MSKHKNRGSFPQRRATGNGEPSEELTLTTDGSSNESIDSTAEDSSVVQDDPTVNESMTVQADPTGKESLQVQDSGNNSEIPNSSETAEQLDALTATAPEEPHHVDIDTPVADVPAAPEAATADPPAPIPVKDQLYTLEPGTWIAGRFRDKVQVYGRDILALGFNPEVLESQERVIRKAKAAI